MYVRHRPAGTGTLLILSDSCVTIHKLLFGGRCVFDVSITRWTVDWCMSFARVQVVHWHGGASPFCRAGGPPGLNEPPQGRTWTLRGTNLTFALRHLTLLKKVSNQYMESFLYGFITKCNMCHKCQNFQAVL